MPCKHGRFPGLTIGPYTIGGLIVERVKFGFSFSTNSQAAFSANVLLARYPATASLSASSSVMGFQSSSEYSCPGQKPLDGFTIAAKDDVMTTCFTVGAFFLMDFKMPVVPMTAGSSKSCLVSESSKPSGGGWCALTFWISVTLKWKGLAVWSTASNGGSETTAWSKASGCAISGTMAKSNWPFST